MALSGPTIWGHLDARLVADWPPALTHSVMPTYSTTFQFCCRSQLFGIAVGEKEQICPFRPCLSLTLWFEYRSLNWIPGARPLHSYSASSSPLPFSPSLLLFTFLHPAYSPSSLFPLCPSPSLLLWNTGGHFLFFFFFFFPASVLLNSNTYVGRNRPLGEAWVETGSRKTVWNMKYFHWGCWLIFTFFSWPPKRVNTGSCRPQVCDKVLRNNW